MSNCKGCGKPIVWMKNEAGKNVPLDPRAPVYMVSRDFLGEKIARLTDEALVSHFATCPKANDFSSSNKKPGGLY